MLSTRLPDDSNYKMPISFDGKEGTFGQCIAHFTSKGKTNESASKICGSLESNQEKESKFCAFGKLELKEAKEDFHVSGFVATSHPDRAVSEDGQYVGDIIPKGTLQKIVNDINNKYLPEAGAVSERHDHIKAEDIDLPVAGVLAPNTVATLRQLEDGHWGAHVDTILSKTNPRYEDVKTNIEQGVYPGFSIEYNNTEFTPTEKEGKRYRLLTDLDTVGFGYAHRRKIGNPHAEYTDFGYKEIGKVIDMTEEVELKALHDTREDIKKTQEGAKKKKKGDKMKDKKEADEETPKEEPKEESKEEEDTEEKKDKPVEVDKKEYTVSAAQFALLTKFKEKEAQESKIKEITDSKEFKETVAARMKEVISKDSPLFNTDNEGKQEFKEFDNYRAALAETKELDKPVKHVKEREHMHKRLIDRQYKEAAKLYNAFESKGINPYRNGQLAGPAESKENAFETSGPSIQMKEFSRVETKALDTASNAGLQTDTNLASTSWTYGSYFLSPVELNDIFQPVLVNQLNDQTTTYGSITKEDWSGRSQIQFRARTKRNSTVGGYDEGVNLVYGTDFSGQVGRDKFQQPYAYYRVLVAITGQAQRFAMAPGGMGDVWADEIKWSGADLLAASGGLNLALIGTGDGTSESASLGFEGLILGTTGTLYGKSLSTYGTLRSHKEDRSSARITFDQLRKMIRFVQTGDGTGSSEIFSTSNLGDLAFYCHHIQRDFIRGLMQDMQRIVPTSSRVGFEGEIEFDGVPVRADRQINTDDIFLINHANTKIAVNLPPTLEPLPVTADAQAAHIKIYWNLYSDAPGNNYWAHTLATS